MSHANTTAVPSAPAPKAPNEQLVLLPLTRLQIDHQYQRGLVARHIATIVSLFDRRIFTPPIIVKRPDGSHWVIDGQQRITALRQHPAGFTHVWVQLIEVSGTVEEAELFVKVNSGAKSLTAQELYKACVYRKTNVALAIERILNDHGGLTGIVGQDPRKEIKAIAKMLEAWGPGTKVYTNFELSGHDPTAKAQFNEGRHVLSWAISAGMPLIRKNSPANKVYNGNVLAALIWIRMNTSRTSLSKVKKMLLQAESPEALRRTVTRMAGSAGGSRRNLFGVRLAYFLNDQAGEPFIALYREDWELLRIHDEVDIDNDPAVLFAPDGDTVEANDPAMLLYTSTDEPEATDEAA